MIHVMCHLYEPAFELSEEKTSERPYRELSIVIKEDNVIDQITLFLGSEQAKALADTIYAALEAKSWEK